MDKTAYEQGWNAAVEWWLDHVDLPHLNQDTKNFIQHNLEDESSKAFEEWYGRNVADPPNAESDLTEGSF